ncbi:MAG: hypothetical protein M1836_001174 [Candelina mexicana]|nr:MAG: hypothetical protein M1836_001174 [Candelina mexicana]
MRVFALPSGARLLAAILASRLSLALEESGPVEERTERLEEPTIVGRATIPAPIVIPASQYWEGNDGPWSSFQLRVGTPEQYPRVLVSTNGISTWVVLPSTGCGLNDTACAISRGTLFNPNTSSTWSDQGVYNLDRELNLDYTGNADYGLEKVGLGLDNAAGPSLDSMVVAAFQDNVYYYMGLFGLSPLPTNFTTFNDPQPSFLTTLRKKNLIPSLSWGYTAGAQYRLKQVFGSLVFGGYDTSKFIPNSLSFNFAPDVERDLVVGLQSITLTDATGKNTSLLNAGIFTFVDSTIPYLYLPLQACQLFEKALGLTWDTASQLYLIDDALRNTLTAKNLNFTFQLANTETGGQNVQIVLPYAAFDLTAKFPLVNNTSRYFPLKRAANDTQYALGRTFLQEAYLITDHERHNFSISQCRWQEGSQQNIVAIRSLADSPNNTSTTSNKSSGSSTGIGVGAIAGIAVGGAAILALAAYLIFAFLKRRWPFQNWRRPHEGAEDLGKHRDSITGKVEVDGHLTERVEMPSPYMMGEMQGSQGKIVPPYLVGELQGSPSPPPHPSHEMMDTSVYQELPGTPVSSDYFKGTPLAGPFRQSPLRHKTSQSDSGADSLPITPIPSPPPVGSNLQFTSPAPSPVLRQGSKPQQRPFEVALPHGSTPTSPVGPSHPNIPAIAVHSPVSSQPTSAESTMGRRPTGGKWRNNPANYSGDDYESDHY